MEGLKIKIWYRRMLLGKSRIRSIVVLARPIKRSCGSDKATNDPCAGTQELGLTSEN